MKLPNPPPDNSAILSKLDPETLGRLFKQTSPLVAGKYIHWDELRHREPPEGLSHEQWWLSVWLGRTSQLKIVPLFDKAGNPFRFATPEPVLIHLHHIDRDAAGQILAPDGTPIRESKERYLLHSLIEEAITSSQLEGASTTRQVAEVMLHEGRKPRNRSERMIFNNYAAMEHIRRLGAEPITPDSIFELHRMLVQDTMDNPSDAGRLRQSDDVRVVDNRDGTVLHHPPSYKELPDRLVRLCAFANASEKTSPFVHPVVRAILVHFMIGYDHPFSDGNGRTARALFYWAMARSGYWLMEFLSISEFLRKAPSQYVQAYLHTETDNNDATYFLLHQLNVIRKAIDALHGYLARKTSEQRDAERLLASSPSLRSRLNHRQTAVLNHALKNPGATYLVSTHQKLHNVVYQTARTDLLDLESLNLLIKEKQGKSFVFYAPDDLQDRVQRSIAEHSGG
jgi:Fic family protein